MAVNFYNTTFYKILFESHENLDKSLKRH